MFVNLLREKSKVDLRLEVEDFFSKKSKPFPDTWKWNFDNEGKVYFIESKSNRKRYGKLLNCECCEREICVRVNSEHKTCSKKCFSLLSQKDKVKLSCANCSKEVLRAQKDLGKSRSGLFFCNRKCKESSQMIGGLKEIQPDHYKDGASSYSDRAFRFYGTKCKDCNINFKPLLAVHHIDGDRSNGNMKNLEVLCNNHHMMRHMVYNTKNNEWVLNLKYLTPRDLLEDLLKK